MRNFFKAGFLAISGGIELNRIRLNSLNITSEISRRYLISSLQIYNFEHTIFCLVLFTAYLLFITYFEQAIANCEITNRYEYWLWYKTVRKILINPFDATDLFLYPLKRQKTRSFLMFSGGIERDQWYDMD